jgi:hypothetical protein
MRIELKTEGGLAYFPGLDKPIRLDSADLSKHDVQELETLIAETQFFDLPHRLNEPTQGAADYRTYTITIKDGSRRHTVQAVEPVDNDEFLALLHFIQEKA